jgi:hypothetical protein
VVYKPDGKAAGETVAVGRACAMRRIRQLSAAAAGRRWPPAAAGNTSSRREPAPAGASRRQPAPAVANRRQRAAPALGAMLSVYKSRQ